VEQAVLSVFNAALLAASRPNYWQPGVVLLHRVVASNEKEEEDPAAKLLVPDEMGEWTSGSEFRTHLGKLRRGVLAKLLRDKLSAAFVKGQQRH
jgi:hypothetical protein